MGPKGRFFSGSAADFQRDQLGFYESCAREYGDFVQTRLGPVRMLLVFHPDAIEELLVTRNRDFTKSLGLRRLRPLVGDGLFLSEGDTWLRQRRLVQPAFHRQRLSGYGDVMTAFTQRHMAGWKDGSVIDVQAEMMALIPWSEVALIFGVTWGVVKRAIRWVVEYGLVHRDLGRVTAIGVDEIAVWKGHKYLTVVYQIDQGSRR